MDEHHSRQVFDCNGLIAHYSSYRYVSTSIDRLSEDSLCFYINENHSAIADEPPPPANQANQWALPRGSVLKVESLLRPG
ncbi:hypothetical protein ABKN59_006927 [Abortiporus biennis]